MNPQTNSNSQQLPRDRGWRHSGKATLSSETTTLSDPRIRQLTNLHLTVSKPERLYQDGLDQLATQNLRSAEACFRAAIQLKWDFPAAHIQLGNIASTNNDYTQALATYHAVIEIDPKEPAAPYNIALTYLDLNDPTNAQTWFQKTITLDRSYTPAYLELANLFTKTGNDRYAIAVLLKAGNHPCRDAQALIRAGQLYYRNTQYHKAIHCYQRATQIDSWNTDAFFHLGIAQYRSGQFGRAALSLAHVLNQDPKHKLAKTIMKFVDKFLKPKQNIPTPTQSSFPFAHLIEEQSG